MPTQPQDTNPAPNGPQTGAERLAADAEPGTAPESGIRQGSTKETSPNSPRSAPSATHRILSPEIAERRAAGVAAWRAAGSPVLDPIAKAAARPESRSLAIAAKCYDCQGGDADPGWRWRIGNCSAPCPLVPVRPHQHLAGTPAPAAIADHAETEP